MSAPVQNYGPFFVELEVADLVSDIGLAVAAAMPAMLAMQSLNVATSASRPLNSNSTEQKNNTKHSVKMPPLET